MRSATMNAGDRDRAARPACSAPTCWARHMPSTWRCASAPAPMSAARRPRCSKASKASAAWCAPSRRCRRIKGLFGKPTVINNVISLASVPIILDKGAAFYKDFGMGRSRGTMPIQLAGNVKHGGLFETAFGMTLGEIVDDIGGGTRSGRPVRAVQVGGPLGAYFPRALFDTPFDYEAFAAKDGLIGHGGIVVFDDTVDMAKQARFAMEFCAIESCGKCTPCRIGSTRGVEVIDRIIAGDIEPREADRAASTDLCNTMKFGSLCALGGFTPISGDERAHAFPGRFSAGARRRSRGIGAAAMNAMFDIMSLIEEIDYGTPASQVREDGDADHRRPQRSPCRKAPRSCARRWRPASRSRSSAPPTCSTPSAPAGSAWSRSRAAAARRPPAPRRSREGMVVHTQTERLERHPPRRDGALRLRPSARLPRPGRQRRLRAATTWPPRSACARSASASTAATMCVARPRRRQCRLHRQGRVQPLFHLRPGASASSARAACAPARRCRAPSR